MGGRTATEPRTGTAPLSGATGRFHPGALSSQDAVLLGVASRLAGRAGASVVVVRVAFGVLALAAGWGVAAYVLGWLALRAGPEPPAREVTLRHSLGVVAATAAQLVLVDQWIGGAQPGLHWPVALVAFALALTGSGAVDGSAPKGNLGRVAAGAVLMVAGVLSGLAGPLDAGALLRGAPAGLVVVGGLTLVFAPWVRQVLADADAERVRRAQAEARADMAAHLHDSVLQTLTLIQNRSDEPDVAAALAHRQERELRRWLYGADHDDSGPSTTLRSALDAVAAEIEDQYLKVVECIVVGDADLTEPVQAVVGAAREAIVNAAKFAGVGTISVYAEVDPVTDAPGTTPAVRVFVRDRGAGFDPDAVPADRRGICDSIHGRLRRVGGAATIRSGEGAGTEVTMWWPA